jgi:hypothetical protein
MRPSLCERFRAWRYLRAVRPTPADRELMRWAHAEGLIPRIYRDAEGFYAVSPEGVRCNIMEAEGQRQIVASEVLPTDAPWQELVSLGFVRGEGVAGDPLFCRCTIPAGWKRQGSDHAMWSYIVDQRGVNRVAIFYKAAFYDRKAHASIAHPGYSLATEAIYGDGPAELPGAWVLLTPDERGDFVDTLDSYAADAERSPRIYGDRMPRVEALRRLIEA